MYMFFENSPISLSCLSSMSNSSNISYSDFYISSSVVDPFDCVPNESDPESCELMESITESATRIACIKLCLRFNFGFSYNYDDLSEFSF